MRRESPHFLTLMEPPILRSFSPLQPRPSLNDPARYAAPTRNCTRNYSIIFNKTPPNIPLSGLTLAKVVALLISSVDGRADQFAELFQVDVAPGNNGDNRA